MIEVTLCPKIIEEGGIIGTTGLGFCRSQCAACLTIGGTDYFCTEYKRGVIPSTNGLGSGVIVLEPAGKNENILPIPDGTLILNPAEPDTEYPTKHINKYVEKFPEGYDALVCTIQYALPCLPEKGFWTQAKFIADKIVEWQKDRSKIPGTTYKREPKDSDKNPVEVEDPARNVHLIRCIKPIESRCRDRYACECNGLLWCGKWRECRAKDGVMHACETAYHIKEE